MVCPQSELTRTSIRDGTLERRGERVLLYILYEYRLDPEDRSRNDSLNDGLRYYRQEQVETLVGLDRNVALSISELRRIFACQRRRASAASGLPLTVGTAQRRTDGHPRLQANVCCKSGEGLVHISREVKTTSGRLFSICPRKRYVRDVREHVVAFVHLSCSVDIVQVPVPSQLDDRIQLLRPEPRRLRTYPRHGEQNLRIQIQG